MYRKLSPAILAVLFTLLIAGCSTTPSTSGKFRSGSMITVGPNETVDDIYIGAGSISVLGNVNDDLVAAGGSIDVRGNIKGDIIAAGGSITIDGPVGDDVRAAGGTIMVRSNVGGDLVASGGSVSIDPSSTVGGDLVVGAGSTRVDGTVKGNALVGSGDLTIAGTVTGNVDASGGRVVIEPTGRIGGNLTYTSEAAADIRPGAQVSGTTTHNQPTTSVWWANFRATPAVLVIAAIVGGIRWFLGTFLLGLVLFWAIPATFRAARDTMIRSAWESVAAGIVVLIVAPILFLIAAIILIIVFGASAIPIVAIPTAIYTILLILTAPVVALVLGHVIMRGPAGSTPPPLWVQLLLGAVILTLLRFIPVVNVIVIILTILFGFGAWLLLVYRNYVRARGAGAV